MSDKPIELLAFNNSWSPGQTPHYWNVGYVMDPEGNVIASHCSSSNSWLKFDLGADDPEGISGPGMSRIKEYKEKYPQGFTVRWIEDARTGKDAELDRRTQLNRLLGEKANAEKNAAREVVPQ